MVKLPLTIPRVWRSQLFLVLATLATSVLSVVLSRQMPWSVIYGELIAWGDSQIMLWLPLWWLVPLAIGTLAIARVYDVRYIVDEKGIVTTEGILQLHQRITRVEFMDIRSVEMYQTLWERFLNIGYVEIGTAASKGMEMRLSGIANPLATKMIIQELRDRSMKVDPALNNQSQVAA